MTQTVLFEGGPYHGRTVELKDAADLPLQCLLNDEGKIIPVTMESMAFYVFMEECEEKDTCYYWYNREGCQR